MIPNIVHFDHGLSVEDRPFSMLHYLAVRSASEVHKPTNLYMWCNKEPKTFWWEQAKPYMTVRKVSDYPDIFETRLNKVKSKTHIVRLCVLNSIGGAYLETDVVSIRSFLDLRKRQVVMGQQGSDDLGDAVILAQPNTSFIADWLAAQKLSNLKTVGRARNSVKNDLDFNYSISAQKLKEIHTLPTSAFYSPTCDLMHDFVFKTDNNYTQDAYCVHMCEIANWDIYENLTPPAVLSTESEFARITKMYLEDIEY